MGLRSDDTDDTSQNVIPLHEFSTPKIKLYQY